MQHRRFTNNSGWGSRISYPNPQGIYNPSSRTTILPNHHRNVLGYPHPKETLLKSLHKSIAEVVDTDKLQEEMTSTIEYEEAMCLMRTRARIVFASRPQNTGGRS